MGKVTCGICRGTGCYHDRIEGVDGVLRFGGSQIPCPVCTAPGGLIWDRLHHAIKDLCACGAGGGAAGTCLACQVWHWMMGPR